MKLKNSQLLLILLSAIIIVFVIKFLNNKNEGGNLLVSFFEIDTTEISKFSLSPMSDAGAGFSITKQGFIWMIEQEGKESFQVSDVAITRALEEFTKLKPSRLASENEESWSKYEVDTAGTLLEIFTTNESDQIIIGKMIFQNKTKVNQYVRLVDDNNVYACESYMEGTFKNSPDKWRNKQNITLALGFWQAVNISGNGDTAKLSRNENGWIVNHSGANLGSEVKLIAQIDAFNALPLSYMNNMIADSIIYSLDILGNNNGNTHLDLYRNAYEMILASDKNKGNYFQIDSAKTASILVEISKIKSTSLIFQHIN